MFHTYEDFEQCSPLSFSIGGFLQNDGATMIGGLSGHGKTLILCSIAKALLSGKGAKLWDLFPVEENACVWLPDSRVLDCAVQTSAETFRNLFRARAG